MDFVHEQMAPATVVTESASGGKKLRRARIAQADVPTKNGSLYSREILRNAVEEINRDGMIGRGHLVGNIDHTQLAGAPETLRNTALVWREVKFEEDDGSIIGGFEILDTAAGRDLSAMLAAGMKPGFSTAANCDWHPPTMTEASRFGLLPFETPRVMDKMILRRIDVVADAACKSAMLLESTRPGATSRGDGQRSADLVEVDPMDGLEAAFTALQSSLGSPGASDREDFDPMEGMEAEIAAVSAYGDSLAERTPDGPGNFERAVAELNAVVDDTEPDADEKLMAECGLSRALAGVSRYAEQLSARRSA